jgi:hypothetical protein
LVCLGPHGIVSENPLDDRNHPTLQLQKSRILAKISGYLLEDLCTEGH